MRMYSYSVGLDHERQLELRTFQLPLQHLPVRHELLQQAAKIAPVIGVFEVAYFVGDNVINAGGWSVDEFGVQVDRSIW